MCHLGWSSPMGMTLLGGRERMPVNCNTKLRDMLSVEKGQQQLNEVHGKFEGILARDGVLNKQSHRWIISFEIIRLKAISYEDTAFDPAWPARKKKKEEDRTCTSFVCTSVRCL